MAGVPQAEASQGLIYVLDGMTFTVEEPPLPRLYLVREPGKMGAVYTALLSDGEVSELLLSRPGVEVKRLEL